MEFILGTAGRGGIESPEISSASRNFASDMFPERIGSARPSIGELDLAKRIKSIVVLGVQQFGALHHKEAFAWMLVAIKERNADLFQSALKTFCNCDSVESVLDKLCSDRIKRQLISDYDKLSRRSLSEGKIPWVALEQVFGSMAFANSPTMKAPGDFRKVCSRPTLLSEYIRVAVGPICEHAREEEKRRAEIIARRRAQVPDLAEQLADLMEMVEGLPHAAGHKAAAKAIRSAIFEKDYKSLQAAVEKFRDAKVIKYSGDSFWDSAEYQLEKKLFGFASDFTKHLIPTRDNPHFWDRVTKLILRNESWRSEMLRASIGKLDGYLRNSDFRNDLNDYEFSKRLADKFRDEAFKNIKIKP